MRELGVGCAAGRDMRPAAHLLSFAPPKESRQRKGGPTGCVPSLRFGQPAVLAVGVRRRTRFVRCAHAAQTTAASQITTRMHAALHSLTPPAALLGASRGEGTAGRAIAALGLGIIDLRPRCGQLPLPSVLPDYWACQSPSLHRLDVTLVKAERSDGPSGLHHALWPCREAQGVGRAWAAQHAHASCSDSLRLSERSAVSAKRVPQRRPATEHRRLPRSEAQGTRPVGSLFFCLLFFGETKKSRSPAGANSRPAALRTPPTPKPRWHPSDGRRKPQGAHP